MPDGSKEGRGQQKRRIGRTEGGSESGNAQKRLYIYGEETYLRQSYLDQVREALVPAGFEEFNYHRLGGKGLSMQALQEPWRPCP